MGVERDPAWLNGLVTELCKLPAETTWLEFKQNNANPEEIGEYISALSNAAALDGKTNAYMVWGVDDGTHKVVGTSFDPLTLRKGEEELESWLLRKLSPRLHFRFFPVSIDGKAVVVLEIPRAIDKPTSFGSREFIRIGTYKKPLKDFAEQERALWREFDRTPFEELIAADNLTPSEALELVDYPSYFELLKLPLPPDPTAIVTRLVDDRLLVRNAAGTLDLTNLGAILFARDLHRFKGLGRKAVRVIVYSGKDRVETLRERGGTKGYAAGFSGLIDYVNAQLPRNEVIGKALRKEVPMYPELSVRELIANALIHQDFSITGTGPMIEVFGDRMEITNPGRPLIEIARLLDSPPRSRNEAIASFMRRIGVCEERGSGVDKVVSEAEHFQLPAPFFESHDDATRAVLFSHKALREMDREERIRACYLHACLRYVQRDAMTNASLRDRFGIEPQNSATASRILRETQEAGVIKPFDPDQGKRHSRYLPFWA